MKKTKQPVIIDIVVRFCSYLYFVLISSSQLMGCVMKPHSTRALTVHSVYHYQGTVMIGQTVMMVVMSHLIPVLPL